jgi:hypothetical protein
VVASTSGATSTAAAAAVKASPQRNEIQVNPETASQATRASEWLDHLPDALSIAWATTRIVTVPIGSNRTAAR